MDGSRMTRLVPLAVAALAVGWAGIGCDARPQEATPEVHPPAEPASVPPRPGPDPLHTPAPRPQATRPDLGKINYDAGTRTLSVYELPDRSARWMLATPNAPMGLPIDRDYQFPMGMELDLDSVSLFYTVPNSRPSLPVSLREILDRDPRAARQ